MTPLERELTLLAAEIEWPETPDLAGQVAARVAASPARSARRGTPRRRVALALALLLAAVLATLAVSPARSAILDWLGIGGARITVVDELPALPPVPGLELLGDRVTLAGAREQAGFSFGAPPADEPAPDEIRVAPGMRVSYLWRAGERVRLLVTQFRGRVDDPILVKKLVRPGTSLEELDLDGDRAIWLTGGPHVVLFVSPQGDVREETGWLAGNTLLVDREGLTLRVEGAVTRRQAVELARAIPY